MDETHVDKSEFWRCVFILLRNYHAVNKTIFACLLQKAYIVSSGIQYAYTWKPDSTDNQAEMQYTVCEEEELRYKTLTAEDIPTEGFLISFKFLTKKASGDIEAIGIIDFTASKYTCKFLNATFDDFSVEWRPNSNGTIAVEILTQRTASADASRRWADDVLKPKLLRWSKSSDEQDLSAQQKTQSLALIDKEEYNALYKTLKSKYAQQTLQFWTEARESTDPLKFIYEDLAIAAYLICLWRRHSKPTAFADLGCGNGLLVYILCAEGYAGYGYDIRARKLWSLYPAMPAMHLIEQAIEPHTFALPPQVDWLIGNHSDELSPWLPVLAARASHKMRYFLLPCCAFELSGEKFQRRTSNMSAYQDFMIYARCISEKCGFVTLQDRLKIPSTKRLALVGTERTHSELDYGAKRTEIDCYVAAEMAAHGGGVMTDPLAVKLRDKNETVRNCTQIDKTILTALTRKIFDMLLETEGAPAVAAESHTSGRKWHAGGRLALPEIAKRLGRDNLLQIKSECGGLKTLLRNKHEIFEFFPCNNEIGIRKPQVRPQKMGNKPLPAKRRECFFHCHHPNGCPLTGEACSFLH